MVLNTLAPILFLGICVSGSLAQGAVRGKQLRELLEAVKADEGAVAECERQRNEEDIRQYGKPRPKLAGHCWDGCATYAAKPIYPEAARKLRLRGQVRVQAIVDEKGKVDYARMVKGNPLFKRSALAAAYASTYRPKVTCGDRPIKFRWTIDYIFRPDM